MKIIKESTGTDKAKEALSNYIDDIEYLTDQVLITVHNTEKLANDIANKRKPIHSLVWQSLLEIIRFDLGEPLTSSQLKAGFRALGIDYKEFLKPVIKRIEEERQDALEESKGRYIEILEKLDKDATVTDIFNILDDINDFDIAQGVRSAIKYGLLSNKVVDYIISYAKKEVIKPNEMKNESLQNDEVGKIIDKIQELETELEVFSSDKEVDKKQLKSIKDKISRLNKKLNEEKDIAEELDLKEEKDKNLESIKDSLKRSGIKSERTLDLMSKDVLKTLQNNYDEDCMDESGNYYIPAITSAIQDVIERITKQRPQIKFGEGRVKELLYANKNINEDNENTTQIESIISDLDSEKKVYIDTTEGYQLLSVNEYPERPEEYDEGYVLGWDKGEDPEYDKEQEERFKEATEAYDEGEVFQIMNVEDDTISAVAYGYKELREILKDMNAQKVNIEDLMNK